MPGSAKRNDPRQRTQPKEQGRESIFPVLPFLRSRRGFAVGCFSLFFTWASSVLCGCTFSLRELVEGEAKSNESDSTQEDEPENPGNSHNVQYGFWMNSQTCIGCGSCVAACVKESNVPDGADPRRNLLSYTFDDGSKRQLSLSCMHCENPACVKVCPAGAVSKREGGIVVADRGLCIGCKYCRQACPFDIPRYTHEGMDKCDLCIGSGVDVGSEPYCVGSCPTGSLRYGTLKDLARISRNVAERLEGQTKPSFFVS